MLGSGRVCNLHALEVSSFLTSVLSLTSKNARLARETTVCCQEASLQNVLQSSTSTDIVRTYSKEARETGNKHSLLDGLVRENTV